MIRFLALGVATALCAAARTLFHEGIACADSADFDCAADRFRRSNDLRPSTVVAFNLAQAEAELGHLVVASELYRVVLREAEGELAQAAQAGLDGVLPRLARVTILVDTSARVMLDEHEMQTAMHGVAIPLDPGEHRLSAFYGDELAAEDTFAVNEGETSTHTFRVPPPAADLTVGEVPEEDAPLSMGTAPEEDHTRRRRILGVTLGIVAATGIAVLLALLLKPSAPDPTQTDLPPVIFE